MTIPGGGNEGQLHPDIIAGYQREQRLVETASTFTSLLGRNAGTHLHPDRVQTAIEMVRDCDFLEGLVQHDPSRQDPHDLTTRWAEQVQLERNRAQAIQVGG